MGDLIDSPGKNQKETVSDSAVQETDIGFQTISFLKNQVIFAQGSPGDHAYLLLKGTVEISVPVDGKKMVLTTLRNRAVFGEMALVLKDHKRTATAMALEDSEAVRIPRHVFEQHIASSPKLISACLMTIAERLQDTTLKAYRSFDLYRCLSNILHLFLLHEKEILFYDETVKSMAGALDRKEEEIEKVISMMECFGLLEIKKAEQSKRLICLIGKPAPFLQKAIKIHAILKENPLGVGSER